MKPTRKGTHDYDWPPPVNLQMDRYEWRAGAPLGQVVYQPGTVPVSVLIRIPASGTEELVASIRQRGTDAKYFTFGWDDGCVASVVCASDSLREAEHAAMQHAKNPTRLPNE